MLPARDALRVSPQHPRKHTRSLRCPRVIVCAGKRRSSRLRKGLSGGDDLADEEAVWSPFLQAPVQRATDDRNCRNVGPVLSPIPLLFMLVPKRDPNRVSSPSLPHHLLGHQSRARTNSRAKGQIEPRRSTFAPFAARHLAGRRTRSHAVSAFARTTP